ncbi:MAG TPA: hypothetical protein VMM37_00730 [Bacteroidota bacterium]|nr:hypothetical protein [Bacteroidota bacterium]
MDKPIIRHDEEQQLTPLWLAIVRFGPAILLALFYVAVVLHFTYTPDDTYIYLQYAKNLANGNGFAFNAGTPSYGVTGPLWVLLIAAGARAGLDPFIVAKMFDILFASLSVVLVYTVSATILRDRVYALLASAAIAADAWFLRWAGTGMETSFAVVLVLLAIKYAYSGDYHIAAFVTGLLTLVRPEGILLFLVVMAESSVMAFVLGRNRSMFWMAAGLYAVVIIPWLAFAHFHFGTIIPNTEFSKSAFHWSVRDVFGTFFDCVSILCSTQLVLVLLLVGGFPYVIRKGGVGTLIAKGMPVVWMALLVAGYALLNVEVISRYLVPLLPVIVIYALWSLKETALASGWTFRTSFTVAAVVVAATVVQSQVVYSLRVVPHMKEFSEGMELGIRPIAQWLREKSSPDAIVLTPNVGMIGYISDRRLFDTAGLITPAVKRSLEGASYDDAMRNGLYRKAVTPDYILDRATVEGRLASDSLQTVMSTRFGGLSLKSGQTVYYTLYKVVR